MLGFKKKKEIESKLKQLSDKNIDRKKLKNDIQQLQKQTPVSN